jgi:hypothetical protein
MSPITHHYVFGYGSLMCAQSRALSAPTLAAATTTTTRKALPVRIRNVVRTWNKRSPTNGGATYLGVQLQQQQQQQQQQNTTLLRANNKGCCRCCVGVLIPMDTTSVQNAQAELEALDEREMGYDRHHVPLEWIDRVDDLLLDDDNDDSMLKDLYRGTFLDDNNNNYNNSGITASNAAFNLTWMSV